MITKIEFKIPFIVAEMSGNHNHSLDRALEIVEAAVSSGVDAVKIQTYTADTMTINSKSRGFIIDNKASLWYDRGLYELYKDASTPWEWHKNIFDACKKHGIICFSTPFDESAVDFLEDLDCPLYKIASFELVDMPLIKKVASKGKPLIMSIGMAVEKEIHEAVDAARQSGCNDITLLKCTSSYPSSPKDSNILTIPDMAVRFGCKVGISDHTMGFGAAVASVALGATLIEKHFTLKRSDGGVDSAFSMEPHEMKLLVDESKNAYESLGQVKYEPSFEEKKSMIYRRSLYAVKGIRKGEVFSKDNVRSIRPGYGLAPKYIEQIIGKTAAKNIDFATPLSGEHISDWKGV